MNQSLLSPIPRFPLSPRERGLGGEGLQVERGLGETQEGRSYKVG